MGWEEKGRRGRVAEILLPGGHVVTHSLEKQLRCTQIVVFIVQLLSCVQFFTTPWTEACQAPLSMGFPRQGYWTGLPCPPPGDLPDTGIDPMPPAVGGGFSTTEPPGKPPVLKY